MWKRFDTIVIGARRQECLLQRRQTEAGLRVLLLNNGKNRAVNPDVRRRSLQLYQYVY